MAVVYPAVSLFTEGQIWVTQSNGGFLILYSPLACLFFWFCLHFSLSGAEGHRLIFPWPGRLSQPRFFFLPCILHKRGLNYCLQSATATALWPCAEYYSYTLRYCAVGDVMCTRACAYVSAAAATNWSEGENDVLGSNLLLSLSCPLTKGFAVLHGGVTGRSSTNESPQFDNLISDNSNEFVSPFSQTVSFIWQQMLQAAPVCEPLVQNLLTTPYVCH